MVGAICNNLSYIMASPFMALWQMLSDKMGNHRRSLVEVESPYFTFGGSVSLRQALRPEASSSLQKYCTNSEKRTMYPFIQDRVILPAAAVREGNIAGGCYTRPLALINV